MTAYVPGTDEKDLTKVILSLQQLAAGRSNAVGTVTLVAGATTTTINDNNISAVSAVQLVPLTSNAAVAVATTYQSATANKQAVLTHANNAQVDRTFRYAIHG